MDILEFLSEIRGAAKDEVEVARLPNRAWLVPLLGNGGCRLLFQSRMMPGREDLKVDSNRWAWSGITTYEKSENPCFARAWSRCSRQMSRSFGVSGGTPRAKFVVMKK
jgi:hypothetical protein